MARTQPGSKPGLAFVLTPASWRDPLYKGPVSPKPSLCRDTSPSYVLASHSYHAEEHGGD